MKKYLSSFFGCYHAVLSNVTHFLLVLISFLCVTLTGCTPLNRFCRDFLTWNPLDSLANLLAGMFESMDAYVQIGIFVIGIAAGALGLFAFQRIFRFPDRHWKVLLGLAALFTAIAALIYVGR